MRDWQEDLQDFLISGGLVGRKQSAIVAKFQSRVNTEMLTNELETYLREQRVQKFSIPPDKGIGRAATVWRATKIMLK